MSRFASAPWPLKAAYVSLLATTALAGFAVVTGIVALAGLERLSAHVDLTAAPAWFWYYRADPNVHRWLGIGALTSAGLVGVVAMAIGRQLRPPLHGAARWATEGQLANAGLRAKQGIVLGRRGGRLLTFGGPEHVMLYAPTRTGTLGWPRSCTALGT